MTIKTREHDKKFGKYEMMQEVIMSDNIYLGNPNLKKANVAQEFTQEQILEFYACRNDPIYFAKKYVKIVSLD